VGVLYFVIKTAVKRGIDESVTAMKVSDVRGFLEDQAGDQG
jgi:hypothetical protein